MSHLVTVNRTGDIYIIQIVMTVGRASICIKLVGFTRMSQSVAPSWTMCYFIPLIVLAPTNAQLDGILGILLRRLGSW